MTWMFPFNHECAWGGPFYVWSSNQVGLEPPKDCKPVYVCSICSAQRPVPNGDEESK